LTQFRALSPWDFGDFSPIVNPRWLLALGEAVVSLRVSAMRIAQVLQIFSLFFIGLVGVLLLAFTLGSAVGLLPWLEFEARFGEFTFLYAGQATQIFVTLVALMLLFFLPAQTRLLSLERAHRDFRITMDDVARAYHHCHAADRAGVFTLSSEFDEVRERLNYLRDHPDLAELETDVLTVAAQMSQQARKLADIYSDEKVKRAKDFLAHRQAEAEKQQALIVDAMHACREIRKWTQQIELEESVVASQLSRLDEQLQAALPALGYQLDTGPDLSADAEEQGDDGLPLLDFAALGESENVVGLPKQAAE